MNTFYKKNHLVTYSSGRRESQIDFIMCRRSHLKEVTNGKVVNGESVTEQHKVLAMDWEIKVCKKRRAEQRTPVIKWVEGKGTEDSVQGEGTAGKEIAG